MPLKTPFAAALLVAFGVLGSSIRGAEEQKLAVRPGDKIAFLGDSITAAGARKNGYVTMVMGALNKEGLNLSHVPAGKSGHKSNDIGT